MRRGHEPVELAVAEGRLRDSQHGDGAACDGDGRQQPRDLVRPPHRIERHEEHRGDGKQQTQVVFRGVKVEADRCAGRRSLRTVERAQ